MSDHKEHPDHGHTHAANCGHQAIEHEDHTGYVHDGHLHCIHGDHVDEHVLAAGGSNPAACTPGHACADHDQAHRHRQGCGHEALPHSDHVDYLVGGHLHHPHGSHCDDHGKVKTA